MSNRLNMTIQKSKINLEFLFEMMSSNNFQFENIKRFNKIYVHVDAFQIDLLDIKLICFEVLQITINMKSNFFDNVNMKFIAIVRNEIVDVAIDMSFS